MTAAAGVQASATWVCTTLPIQEAQLQHFWTCRHGPPPVSVLDVGCGIRPQNVLRAHTWNGVDAHLEYLERLQCFGAGTAVPGRPLGLPSRFEVIALPPSAKDVEPFPDGACLLADLRRPLPFGTGACDIAWASDVLEHLHPLEALALLAELRRVSRRGVFVRTPLGFLEQSHPDEVDQWGLNGGRWQEHRSGWTPDELGAVAAWTIPGFIEATWRGATRIPLKQPRDWFAAYIPSKED